MPGGETHRVGNHLLHNAKESLTSFGEAATIWRSHVVLESKLQGIQAICLLQSHLNMRLSVSEKSPGESSQGSDSGAFTDNWNDVCNLHRITRAEGWLLQTLLDQICNKPSARIIQGDVGARLGCNFEPLALRITQNHENLCWRVKLDRGERPDTDRSVPADSGDCGASLDPALKNAAFKDCGVDFAKSN